MRKTFLFALAIACFTAFRGGAIPILVGEGHTGDNSPATTYAFAQSLLSAYNTANNPDLPAIPAPPSFDVNTGYPRTDTPSSPKDDVAITVSGSYAYVLFKWGGADKNPHEVQLFYVDAPGTYLFDAPTYLDGTNLKQNGLSHYDFFQGTTTKVPDAGSSLMLLPLALAGVAVLGKASRLAWLR